VLLEFKGYKARKEFKAHKECKELLESKGYRVS